MNINLKQLITYILGAFLIIGGVAFAGSLTPSVNISTPNFVTLSDIYNKILNNTYTVSTHLVSTTSAPVSSMNTLSDIWNAIPTISAGTIINGTTIMGVAGTYNISNLTPDKVLSGITYGTSSTGTSAGVQPTEWYGSDTPTGTTDWNTGSSICAGLSTAGGAKPGVAWRLPTYQELLTIYLDNNGTPPGFQGAGVAYPSSGDFYWSNTDVPTDNTSAYAVGMDTVYTTSDSKDDSGYEAVRCAR